jgi:hypothetical protein
MASPADAIRNALAGVPLPEDRPPLPDAPECERLADEIIAARHAPPYDGLRGLDPIVFGAEL